jgi:hypothetical protein
MSIDEQTSTDGDGKQQLKLTPLAMSKFITEASRYLNTWARQHGLRYEQKKSGGL